MVGIRPPLLRAVLMRGAHRHPLDAARRGPTFTAAQHAERLEHLKKIYHPFAKFEKNSPEYFALAETGLTWHNWSRQDDSVAKGYHAVQDKVKDALVKIDATKAEITPQEFQLVKLVSVKYAHQSLALEDINISDESAHSLNEFLYPMLLPDISLTNTVVDTLRTMPSIPDKAELSDDDPRILQAYVNHVIAAGWIVSRKSSAALTQEDMQFLCAMILHWPLPGNTPPMAQEFRKIPLQVASNHMAVFPYPREIPANMTRFLEWLNQVESKGQLHPLLVACQLMVYFVNIHPFEDGNGRTGRLLMLDYMIRKGYLPVVMRNLERKDYLRMISEASNGRPHALIQRVLDAQLAAQCEFFENTFLPF